MVGAGAGSGTDTLAGGAVVQNTLVARLFGVRLLTVEGTILLAPTSYYAPPPVATHPDATPPSEGQLVHRSQPARSLSCSKPKNSSGQPLTSTSPRSRQSAR